MSLCLQVVPEGVYYNTVVTIAVIVYKFFLLNVF